MAEALSNAARHAGPGRRRIHYDWRAGECRVAVEDEGVGFDPATTPAGLGLRGMRERAEVLGGRLSVTSQSGRGTRVELILPEDGR